MDQELQFHLDLETNRLLQQGLTPGPGAYRALRTFGGVEKVREECREARRTSWADTLGRNIRYARRALRRQPGYVAAVVVTLGLGIGANTAIFSVIDGVLLKPLPYASGDRLRARRGRRRRSRTGRTSASRSRSCTTTASRRSAFDGAGRVPPDEVRPAQPRRARPRQHRRRLANFFDVLGIKPMLGRTFVAPTTTHGRRAVLVLSYAYWQTKFGGDPTIVGQVFEMNDRPHTVVGVLPQRAALPAGERRLHAGVGVPVPRARRSSSIGQNRAGVLRR